MKTFLFIVAVMPWSLISLLVWKLLKRPKIYGKFWLVTERYLDTYDLSKEKIDGTVPLIVVKQVEGENNESVDAREDSATENGVSLREESGYDSKAVL